MSSHHIEAVAFDCYGTLVDFGDASFVDAYGLICAEQGIPVSGRAFYDKWMEVWRRLAQSGASSDGGSIGALTAGVRAVIREAGDPERPQSIENEPGPLSEAGPIPPHPAHHHTPAAGRDGALDGPSTPYRPYREEWPEHFALCFEELGVTGDPHAAHERLRQIIASAAAFAESRSVVGAVAGRLPIALMSNADDDFLLPCLARNGLAFPIVISSETARAYKPHAAIFRSLCEALDVAPQRVLYVGDSRLADIVGARHAGLNAAWLNRPAAVSRSLDTSGWDTEGVAVLDQYPPDYEIASLEAVLDVLGLR